MIDLDLVEQIALYFERFGSKSCCAADLASAIEELSEADKMRLQKLLPDCEDPNVRLRYCAMLYSTSNRL